MVDLCDTCCLVCDLFEGQVLILKFNVRGLPKLWSNPFQKDGLNCEIVVSNIVLEDIVMRSLNDFLS